MVVNDCYEIYHDNHQFITRPACQPPIPARPPPGYHGPRQSRAAPTPPQPSFQRANPAMLHRGIISSHIISDSFTLRGRKYVRTRTYHQHLTRRNNVDQPPSTLRPRPQAGQVCQDLAFPQETPPCDGRALPRLLGQQPPRPRHGQQDLYGQRATVQPGM